MLTKENIQDIYSLSPMQEGLFFHSLLDKSSSAYLEQFSYRLEGPLDIACVEKSLHELIRRYDVLRTVFLHKTTERPIQVVLRQRPFALHYQDLSHCPQGLQAVAAYKQEDRANTFDLGKDMLMRVAVFRLNERKHEFIWTFHHILLDGWCLGILNEDFFHLYHCLLEGREHRLPAVKPYVDYIKWLEKTDKDQAKQYWKDYLQGYRSTLAIPGKVREPAGQLPYLAARQVVELDKEQTERLVAFAGQQQATVNSVLQSVWALLLARYNHTQDVVFGAVVSGRPAQLAGVEEMVGLFVNTIPVRIRVSPDCSFTQLLGQVQAQALQSEPFHYYPLADIQAHSEQKHNLLDHLLVYENFPTGASPTQPEGEPAQGLRVSGVEVFEQTHYDFSLLCAQDEQLSLRFCYNANAYQQAVVAAIAGHFVQVLHQVVGQEDLRLGDIELMSEAETGQVLAFSQGRQRAYPHDKTIHGLFEQQAAKSPQATALVCQGEHLSYQQLNERANQLAGYLRGEQGVLPGQMVALINSRSGWMPLALLAILKAGAVYVPIEADCPAERLAFILGDTRAGVVITAHPTHTATAGMAATAGTVDGGSTQAGESATKPSYQVLDLPRVWEQVAQYPTDNLQLDASPQELAYVIYTSGSTGTPKGVMVEHQGPVNMAFHMIEQFEVTQQDNVLQFSSLAFDASMYEMLIAFFSGAALTLISRPLIQDEVRFPDYLSRHGVTIAVLTPSFLSVFDISQFAFLRVLISAGEAINVRQAVAGSQFFRCFNGYGPTECSVCTTTYEVTGGDEASQQLPIGRPIANTQVYILDEDNRLLPLGVPGHICLAGIGLARGYLNQPQLTARHFVENPFLPGHKLYRTGDLGRWLPDGNIEYLGRKDNQVKLRGYRIELSEIQLVLKNHPEVTDAVVLCRNGTGSDDGRSAGELVGYYSARQQVDPQLLRQHLQLHLPPYMIPPYLMQLPAFTTNSSGKIDTKALLALTPAEAEDKTSYAPPRGAVEEKLAAIWKLTLKVDQVGIHENYFHIGGNSINMIKAYNLIGKAFPLIQLEVADLFKGYTIAILGSIIEAKHDRAALPESEFYSLEL